MNDPRDTIRERRARLVQDIALRYGVPMYPDPRRLNVVNVARSDYDYLVDAIATDPRLDALGRGYYTGLGGALDVRPVPNWTCDPVSVSLARGYAHARRLSRALTRPLAAFIDALGRR
ncbi:hypothetical protein [Microbacterium caowuchunii]|uniref:Uncharacterized protein n=1 Tax=Microbacterium caowuchunii TaxID=2614638 RepID=A0A5N0TK95_9MICO|nr:hypothetical protein [Microbacterium caowuchunii]KAA9133749.1 hypothetical protein F6B40_08330 [Microbacterium caowuchunii]